jgi:hypothetical protein
MQVKFRESVVSAEYGFRAGKTYELDEDKAKEFCRLGLAELVPQTRQSKQATGKKPERRG